MVVVVVFATEGVSGKAFDGLKSVDVGKIVDGTVDGGTTGRGGGIIACFIHGKAVTPASNPPPTPATITGTSGGFVSGGKVCVGSIPLPEASITDDTDGGE